MNACSGRRGRSSASSRFNPSPSLAQIGTVASNGLNAESAAMYGRSADLSLVRSTLLIASTVGRPASSIASAASPG